MGKTSPQHDAATTMLHCGDGVLGMMRDVGFAPDIAFSLMAKKLHFFNLTRVPSSICLGSLPHALLIFFFKQSLFSGHSSVKLMV